MQDLSSARFCSVYLILTPAEHRNNKGLITVCRTSPHNLPVMQAAVTIVPLTADLSWGWLHHPSVPLPKCGKILRLFNWFFCPLFSVFLFPLCALRKGYEAASKYFEPQDLDVSVVGRSFMITGANSGIGRATAMAIAKKGKWWRRLPLQSCALCWLKSLMSV